MAEFYAKRFRSELTSRRITQTTKFGMDLSLSNQFRNQLYEHVASLFALMDQNSDTLLIHFESLISLGSVTKSLARQYNWDETYIERVQNLYKMEDYDAQNWFEPFNRYLEVRKDYRQAGNFFKILLNKAVKPDQHFNLQRVRIPALTEEYDIYQDDIKMISISTDILNIPGTIFQLERTFTTSTQLVDDERMSTVDEILSQVSADTNNTSREISIINDETQRGWNLSANELDQLDSEDESIILEVCDHFDGQAERICGAPLQAGEKRCPNHNKPEFNQPMELIKQLKELEPGRAFSLMKGLLVEIPRQKVKQNAKYANSMNGDTKAFLNSLDNMRKLFKISHQIYPGQGKNDDFRNFNVRLFTQAFEEAHFSETHWYAIYQSIKETLIHKSMDLNVPWIDHLYLLANKQGRNQGYLDIARDLEKQMATEDGTAYWHEPYTKTILDHHMSKPVVKEKVPGLYLTKNKSCLPPYLTHQTDGRLSQSGQYETGFYQSENSQPNMGIFFNERALQYENPDDDTAVSMKALVKIQVEQELFSKRDVTRGKFHDKLCLTASDKPDKIKVQMASITTKVKQAFLTATNII